MPAPAPAKKPEVETLAVEERIRRRAYELFVERGNEEEIQTDQDQAVSKS